MKRTIRTLTAATMAGAIAFSATPAAHAIDQDQLAGWVEQGLPEAFADEAGNYYRLIGEEYVKSELPATPADLAEAPTFVRNADGSFTFDGGVNVDANPAPAASLEDLPADVEITVEGDEAANVDAAVNGVTDTRAVTAGRVAEAKCGEETWYLTKDGKAYVGDKALTDVAELPADAKVRTIESVQKDCVFTEGAAAAPEGEVQAELSPGAIAAIAAAAIGVPIVIAGVTYFLNQDGETLVGSSDRVDQQPTPEEKAKSDQLRAEHADEIAAQQVAAAANRGVEAETGSNTVARTLFALVIASVLGTAAFLAGRRFLV
ncbi:hypothetical protein [Corynebacterium sp. MSK008]|uniref:hypothetical protein n=1 Tax=Corynebacterium sp. MSK008 TaxID=3050188 RepID=UPI00254ECCE6|nr:hypothetical protein [Corynebacterium sp. MSK008]MDK8879115.1 hypothetical protein [Corynebacterium sp. MSK008]